MPTPSVIDLSHWQGDAVDFTAIKGSGIIGAIHKATEGSGVYDAAYDKNRSNAELAGLAWGAYHFLRPGDMVDQAEFFLKYAKPDDFTLLAADHEDSGVSLNDLKVFLQVVRRRSGINAVVYSGSVIRQQLGDVRDVILAQHRFWLSYYTTEEQPPAWPKATWPEYWLWQYTNTGKVPGIEGDVDLNAFGPLPGGRFVWAGERRPPVVA
jgi:GH25 family lysozyme M1 (1,4-beta-N-acetylmuramidase)